MSVSYDLITEISGTPITEEAASMFYTRYVLAAELGRGRRTLEIGCASGTGLGLMLRDARSVVGGDLFFPMLRSARAHYGSGLPLAQFSATDLPFKARSFDVVVFMEATYYVPNFDRALDEIARVLDADGVVLFVNANPERPDFIPSPHSEHYHSAVEFRHLLGARGFEVHVSAAFALEAPRGTRLIQRMRARALPAARRFATALNLVPKTLRGRARIKRLLFGKLRQMPAELPPDFAPVEPRVAIDEPAVTGHKVIYVIGRRVQPGVGELLEAADQPADTLTA
jgi:SAM-dependent methyltransferase